MDPKSAIFIIIASVLTMAVYSSSTNFVSAADECFGTSSQGYVICTYEYRNNIHGEVSTKMQECVKGADGKWACHPIGAAIVMPPGLKDAIKKSLSKDGLGLSTK
jgi:hypothetical protein